jgi:predicted membrane channel-forming protein YqfA (hemolysin III family)
MEYLGAIGLFSFLGLFFSAVMGNYIRLRQLSVFILLSVVAVTSFSQMNFYLFTLLMLSLLLVPIAANGIVYISSIMLLKRNENLYGKTGIELRFNLKNSYVFFIKE